MSLLYTCKSLLFFYLLFHILLVGSSPEIFDIYTLTFLLLRNPKWARFMTCFFPTSLALYFIYSNSWWYKKKQVIKLWKCQYTVWCQTSISLHFPTYLSLPLKTENILTVCLPTVNPCFSKVVLLKTAKKVKIMLSLLINWCSFWRLILQELIL